MYRAIFTEYNDKIPMMEFLETLSLQEKAELINVIEKLIEFKIITIGFLKNCLSS